MIYFSNETHCRKISAAGTQYCDTFFSDHEETDTKLVALVKGYECGNNILFIVLFMLHISGSNIFLDTGHGDAGKIIDISCCPMLSKIKYHGLSGIHAFSGNDYISRFFRKSIKKFWKMLLKYPEYRDIFTKLGANEMLQEDTLKEIESFVCKLYGYKKLSSVNGVRKCIFMSKYDKGKKSLDLCMLPSCQDNLRLHMKRANCVATIFYSANMLIMDLYSPLEHYWDENLANVWSNIAFPEDVSDMFFAVDERSDYENNDESSGKESPEEYLSDLSGSEESDINITKEF